VPFFFKQWGEWQNGSDRGHKRAEIVLNNGRHARTAADLGWSQGCETNRAGERWHDFDPCMMARVGKARAGRLLDGREWNEMPERGNRAASNPGEGARDPA